MWVVAKSVVLYLGLPLFAGFLTCRWGVRKSGEEGFRRVKSMLDTLSLIGLLFTLVVMFALTGDLIVERLGIIVKLAVPMTLFFWGMFAAVDLVGWRLGFNYKDTVAVAFNSTGRHFEIAIAIAITAFNPTVALATVVGPLIEVPVMLVLVWLARRTRDRMFARAAVLLPAPAAEPEQAAAFRGALTRPARLRGNCTSPSAPASCEATDVGNPSRRVPGTPGLHRAAQVDLLDAAFLLAGAMVTFVSREVILHYLGTQARKATAFPPAAGASLFGGD